MKIRFLKFAIAVVLISTFVFGSVYAEQPMPRADEVFSSAYAYIYSNKNLKISCVTYDPHNIRITSCWYEVKVNGDWDYGAAISLNPSSVSNSLILGAEKNCASYFGTGTYRVGFTVDADGHSITRYSNERTY